MPVVIPIQHRKDTAANWASTNPTLLAGEIGYVTDTKLYKTGDGATAWTALPYNLADGGSPSALLNKMQARRGTAAAWTSANPVLAAGELGFETDTGKFKIGDGATAWTAIATYFQAGAAGAAALYTGTASNFAPGNNTLQAWPGASISIPYSAIGPNGQILVSAYAALATNSNNISLYARINGTQDLAGHSGTTAVLFRAPFLNRGGAALNMTMNALNQGGAYNNYVATAIDTSGGFTVDLWAQLQVTSNQTYALRRFQVETLYGA